MPNFSVSFRAMGSQITAWLTVPDIEAAHLLDAVPDWFEDWEATFSRFRAESELFALNTEAGEWVSVSPSMFEVTTLAVNMAEETGGLFNPLILSALEAAGYDHNFDPDRFTPGPRAAVKPVADWRKIELDANIQAIRLPVGARIDLGGLVKGWAAEQAANHLQQVGPCLVDAGGDLVGRGSPDDSGGWLIRVEPPGAAKPCQTIVLRDAAIATSGTDYRRWTRGEQTLHHLIDPRTGRPAESKVISSTVVAPQAVRAEAWAKAALIAGRVADLPALLACVDGSVKSNEAFEKLCKDHLALPNVH